MKPAWSVVAFTVLSGAGLGMLVVIALLDLATIAHVVPAQLSTSLARSGAAALALIVVGLCASTLHLGNPRNAWRSLARIKSSWLSREAAFALALLPLASGWIASVHFEAAGTWRALLALPMIALAWLTLYCTAMIYASLKPVRAWHTKRVPLAYLALGHASGALAAVAMLRLQGAEVTGLAFAAGLLLVAAAAVKLDYYAYLAGERGRLTIEQAIGVPQGVGPPAGTGTVMRARLFEAGHSGGTFLTREFGYTLRPAQRVALRMLFWIAGLLVPLLWLASGLDEWQGAALALATCLAGFAAERWLFFAEARHTVRLYHGDRTT